MIQKEVCFELFSKALSEDTGTPTYENAAERKTSAIFWFIFTFNTMINLAAGI